MAPILSKPLIPGNVIIDCKPLIHILKEEFKGIHCDQCLKRIDLLKKCSNCKQMYYCDQKCQRIDWKSHKNECQIYSKPNYDSKQTTNRERLTLRIWTRVKTDESFSTKRYQLFDGSDVCLDDIEVKTKESTLDMEIKIAFKLLSNHLKDYGLKFDRKKVLHWFVLISTNFSCNEILYYNRHNICVPIGIGIYIQLSSLKHSCNPNSALVTNGLSAQVRAMKDIAIGEEITISYIDLAKNKIERQTLLKKLYYLNCKCDKCQLNLDSSVNYNKFKHLFKQLMDDSISIHLKDTKHDWNKSNTTSTQILALYKQIYGEYYPQMTLILMLYLDVILMVSKEFDENVIQLYKTVDRSIKITHGENHELYKSFKLFCKELM